MAIAGFNEEFKEKNQFNFKSMCMKTFNCIRILATPWAIIDLPKSTAWNKTMIKPKTIKIANLFALCIYWMMHRCELTLLFQKKSYLIFFHIIFYMPQNVVRKSNRKWNMRRMSSRWEIWRERSASAKGHERLESHHHILEVFMIYFCTLTSKVWQFSDKFKTWRNRGKTIASLRRSNAGLINVISASALRGLSPTDAPPPQQHISFH